MTTRIPGMRIPLQVFLVAFAAIRSASALTVPDLPSPVFADTEVSTNVAIRAWTERTRMFNVVLSFDATPSNNVQVAFGTDASADGIGPRGRPGARGRAREDGRAHGRRIRFSRLRSVCYGLWR